MAGRSCCSEQEKKSASFIANEMSLAVKTRVTTQRFTLTAADSSKPCRSQNVYCFIDNKAPSTILLSAHFDHIGYGGKLSKSIGQKAIHPGADDNASGIALMLGLLKNRNNWMRSDVNYLFVAYSAHEVGLFGSKFFALHFGRKPGKIGAVLNFDMVGRLNPTERWLVVHGAKGHKVFEEVLPENGNDIRGRLEDSTKLYQLDTKWFIEKGIPCYSFTTGIHEDYHKTSDTPEKINYAGLYKIQTKLEELLKRLK